MTEEISNQQESFNKFIEANPAEIATIISMNERLTDYGRSVRDEIFNRSLERSLASDIKNIFGDKAVTVKQANNDSVSYLVPYLKGKKDQSAIIEIDFDKYKLHWGIMIYSHNKYNVFDKEVISNVKWLDYESLREYCQSIGLINEDSSYQQELKETNYKDKIVSILNILPTGNREKDIQQIQNKLNDVLKRIKKGEKAKPITAKDTNNKQSKQDWAKLLEDYKEADLTEEPKKIKTFLEVAGINEKELYISKVLAFFLDAKEPHPFDNLFFRAFYRLYTKKDIEDNVSIGDVRTEESTKKQKRIDIMVETDKHVMIIENKIRAPLDNDLDDYGKHIDDIIKSQKDLAESENIKDSDIEKRDKILIVLSPEKQKELSKFSDKWKSITYQELYEEILGLLGIDSLRLYQMDKHYLYMNLFHDLFRSIANIIADNQVVNRFETEFLKNKGNSCRQAIHNYIVYRNDIYDKVKNNVEEQIKQQEANKKVKKRQRTFKHHYPGYDGKRKSEYLRAYQRAGNNTNYCKSRKNYMLRNALFYSTKNHVVPYDQTKEREVAIGVYKNIKKGSWIFYLCFINGAHSLLSFSQSTYSHIDFNNLTKHIHDQEFMLSKPEIASQVEIENESMLQFEVKSQANKEADEKLLTEIFVDTITNLENK